MDRIVEVNLGVRRDGGKSIVPCLPHVLPEFVARRGVDEDSNSHGVYE